MAEICKVCGAEIPDIAAFCPQCGSSRPPKPEKKKKVKWWMILIPVILVIALAVMLLWKPLSVRLAPEMVLAKAAANTMADIKARNEGSPFVMLSNAVGETKQHTVDIAFDYHDDYAGDISLDMTAQYDMENRKSLVDISMSMYEITVDAEAYLDSSALAMRMDQVTGETYYGIVFDTFSEDIRNNSLLYDAIGEEMMCYLEEYVDMLQESLNNEDPELALSDAYGEILKEYLAELKPAVASEKMQLSGKDRSCYTITYTLTDADVGMLLEKFLDALEDDEQLVLALENYYHSSGYTTDWETDWNDFLESGREYASQLQEEGEGVMTLSFWLYNDRIVNFDLDYTGEDEDGEDVESHISLLLGENAAEDDIVLTVSDGEETTEISLVTQKDAESMAENLRISVEGSEDDGFIVVSYDWNREDGDLEVSFEMDVESTDAVAYTLDMVLTEGENGFNISVPDLGALISAIEEAEYGYSDVYECSISCTVTAGADIETPTFVNLGELTESMVYEMMMNLYTNFG